MGSDEVETGDELALFVEDVPDCTCCPVHEERNRRMEQRVYEIHVILADLAGKIGPALTMIGQPGGIAAVFNPFKRQAKS